MPESSLSPEQRQQSVALFESGASFKAVSRHLDLPVHPVRALHLRWRLFGQACLVSTPSKRVYSPELEREVAERFLAGESKVELTREFGLSSPRIVRKWAQLYRDHGPEALQPARRGRPPAPDESEMDELQRLRRENERLRAEVAYLGKLKALREERRG